jgi:hypothetical protein
MLSDERPMEHEQVDQEEVWSAIRYLDPDEGNRDREANICDDNRWVAAISQRRHAKGINLIIEEKEAGHQWHSASH